MCVYIMIYKCSVGDKMVWFLLLVFVFWSILKGYGDCKLGLFVWIKKK